MSPGCLVEIKGHLSANPEEAGGLFPSISPSLSFSSTAVSGVLAAPAPQILVTVFTALGRGCKRKSMVNLYQTSPSHHHWHFPDEALQFHPPCLSASSVPSSNPYRLHTPSPAPRDSPAWDPFPWWRAYSEGAVHVQLHVNQLGGIALCKP